MAAPSLSVAALQMPPGHEDLALNRRMLEEAITQAVKAGAQLVALPELALMPYFCAAPAGKYRHWAESVQGESSVWCAELAQRLGCAILLPLYEHDSQNDCYHNTVIGFDRQEKNCATEPWPGSYICRLTIIHRQDLTKPRISHPAMSCKPSRSKAGVAQY